MRNWIPLLGIAIAFALFAGCVVSNGTESSQSAGGTAVARPAGDQPVMLINGEKIYAADVLSSPMARGFLRQYIFFRAVNEEAAASGVTVDPAKLEEQIEAVQRSVIDNGEDWDEYLAAQAITEEEFRENVAGSLLFEAIVADRVDLSEEKLREVWDEEQTQIKDEYMRTNHYPDSMRSSITFGDCRETLRQKVLRRDGFPIMDELNKQMLRDSTIELLCFDSDQDAEKYEYLILYSVDEQMRRAEEAAVEAQAEAGSAGASATGRLVPDEEPVVDEAEPEDEDGSEVDESPSEAPEVEEENAEAGVAE